MIRRALAVTVLAMVATMVAAMVPVGTGGADVVVPDPVGPIGYTSGFNSLGKTTLCNFYSIALGNGVGVSLGSELPCVDGLTFSSAGVLYGFTVPGARGTFQSQLVTINTATGAQTVVGPLGKGFLDGGMTFDKDGKLWLFSQPIDDSCAVGSCLYSVDPATGAATQVGGQRAFTATGLAADCSTVYATGYLSSGVPSDSLYTIDTTTGVPTLVGSLGQPVFTEGLDFAADGTLYTLGEPRIGGPVPYAPTSYTVNKATGAATNKQSWLSLDPVPTSVFGLAVSGLSCQTPAPPEVQPTFTG